MAGEEGEDALIYDDDRDDHNEDAKGTVDLDIDYNMWARVYYGAKSLRKLVVRILHASDNIPRCMIHDYQVACDILQLGSYTFHQKNDPFYHTVESEGGGFDNSNVDEAELRYQ